MRFTGKVAIVTGAGRGIGQNYALGFAAEGARVVVAEIDEAAGRETAQKIIAGGGQAQFVRTDIGSEADTRALAAAVVASYGGIDILVNNAALFANLGLKPTEQISVEEWDRVMAINLRGPFLMAKTVLPQMKSKGYGKIVNISSNTVFSGGPLMAHYVASKAGIIGLTRSLAREVGGFGIRVNAVTPGLTDTAAAESLVPPERFEVVTQLRSIHRRQTPEDLVGAVMFLCSADSDFMTGQIINVDGGQILY